MQGTIEKMPSQAMPVIVEKALGVYAIVIIGLERHTPGYLHLNYPRNFRHLLSAIMLGSLLGIFNNAV